VLDADGPWGTSRVRIVAAGVLSLQALGLLVTAADAVRDPGQGWAFVAAEVVVLALLAIGLVSLAAGIARARGWSRTPALVAQALAVLVAVSYAGLDTWLGWALALPALTAALVVLAMPHQG
jgi:hypothetical protein